MRVPLVLRPEADADLLRARDWYDQQRAGLGNRFAAAAEEMLDQIEEMPEMYAVVMHGVRRAKLKKFPYIAYYRILADRVEVIGVLHGSRDDRVWQERV